MDKNVLATVIRERREALGLSQKALGEKVGRTQTAVSAWEQGKNLITPDDFRNLSDTLGISAEERAALWLRVVGEGAPGQAA